MLEREAPTSIGGGVCHRNALASERQRRRREYVTIRFPLGAYTFSAHCTAVRELKQRCENEFFPAIDKNTPACADA